MASFYTTPRAAIEPTWLCAQGDCESSDDVDARGDPSTLEPLVEQDQQLMHACGVEAPASGG